MNNTQTSSKKNLLIGIAIVAIAAVGYFYYKGTLSPSDLSLQEQPDTTAVGSQVLSLLNQIQSLRIDTSLFTDPGYQTLRDYSVSIPQVNVGRINPFAPLPGTLTAQAGGTSAGARH